MRTIEQRLSDELPMQQVLSMNPWDRDELLEALINQSPIPARQEPTRHPPITPGDLRLMTVEEICLRMTFYSMN